MNPLTAHRLIPLELMQTGESGVVFDVEGSESVAHRLSEMGISKGVTIQMVKSGSPCIVAISNHRLSLRIDDSVQVLVEVGS